MDYLLVTNDLVAVGKGNFVDCYIDQHHKILSIDDTSVTDNSVCDLAISNNNKYFAILTSSKKLTVYRLPSFEHVNLISLPRSASKIRFGAEDSSIFVADKTGDVIFYNIFNGDSGVKLLGHLSFLLNVLQSHDGNYLISADRDEKIRVSCYPNTYNIQTYCLGHKEFVNHIEFLPHNDKYLLSASGDGTIKCWDYVIGHCTCTIVTKNDLSDKSLQEKFKDTMDKEGIEVESLPIVQFTTSKLNETSSLIAVSIYSYSELLIYSFKSIDSKYISKLIGTIQFEGLSVSLSLFKSSLFVFNSINNVVTKYDIINAENNTIISAPLTIEMFVEKTIDIINGLEQNIKTLFKRKFDNVQIYQDRKKNRLVKNI